MVEKVQYFRYRGIGHYKQKCPNIEVEKKRRRREETTCSIKEKVQQQKKVREMEPVYPNWKKVQEYYGVENVPEDAWLLELGQMIKEVIATYIEYKWYGEKGIYWEDNRGQGVLRRRRLEEAKWCRCPRQRRKEGNVVYLVQEKMQLGSVKSEPPKSTAEEEGNQMEVRRTFKMLKKVQLNIGIKKMDTYERVTVKALLDSSTTGMFMDRKMTTRHGF